VKITILEQCYGMKYSFKSSKWFFFETSVLEFKLGVFYQNKNLPNGECFLALKFFKLYFFLFFTYKKLKWSECSFCIVRKKNAETFIFCRAVVSFSDQF